MSAAGNYWDIQGNYGQGWEVVTAEHRWADARERLREYRENEPGFRFRARWIPKPRLRYGEQSACELCGMDVAWLGKPFRRVLVPASAEREEVTMTDGGWRGRGGDRFCDESGAARYDENGCPVPYPHRLHRRER